MLPCRLPELAEHLSKINSDFAPMHSSDASGRNFFGRAVVPPFVALCLFSAASVLIFAASVSVFAASVLTLAAI